MVSVDSPVEERVQHYANFGFKVEDNGMEGLHFDTDTYIYAEDIRTRRLNINDTTNFGSVLHTTISSVANGVEENRSNFSELLKQGANPYIQDNNNYDAFNLLRVYQQYNPNELLDDMGKELLAYVIPVDSPAKDRVRTFEHAVDNGCGGVYFPIDNDLTLNLFMEDRININDTSKNGSVLHTTALRAAVGLDETDDFGYLLERGANPHAANAQGHDISSHLEKLQSRFPGPATQQMSKILLEQCSQRNGYLSNGSMDPETSDDNKSANMKPESPNSLADTYNSSQNPKAKKFKPSTSYAENIKNNSLTRY